MLEGFAKAAARILHTIHVSEGECSPKEGECECSVSYPGASSSRLCPNPRPRRVFLRSKMAGVRSGTPKTAAKSAARCARRCARRLLMAAAVRGTARGGDSGVDDDGAEHATWGCRSVPPSRPWWSGGLFEVEAVDCAAAAAAAVVVVVRGTAARCRARSVVDEELEVLNKRWLGASISNPSRERGSRGEP